MIKSIKIIEKSIIDYSHQILVSIFIDYSYNLLILSIFNTWILSISDFIDWTRRVV